MSNVVGGPSALLSILSCCRDFVSLEFSHLGSLALRCTTRSSRLEASISIQRCDDATCFLNVKDLVHALDSCDTLAAPVFRIEFDAEEATVCLTAKEEDSIDFSCSIRTVDAAVGSVLWLGTGDELASYKVDTDLLFTAFSQVLDSSIDRVHVIIENDGIHLASNPNPTGVTTDVHIPQELLESINSEGFNMTFAIPQKDISQVVGFMSVFGDLKSFFRVFRSGIRFERSSFVTTSQPGSLEILTVAV